MATTGGFTRGERGLARKESSQREMQAFLKMHCYSNVSRGTWLLMAEKFGKFLSWNELACSKSCVFFPVVGGLRGDPDKGGNESRVFKEYWFFDLCVGGTVCKVQRYDALGDKIKDGDMKVFSDACGNVTNEKMELFMSWKTFIRMPPLPKLPKKGGGL
jgi:hypothetical protein